MFLRMCLVIANLFEMSRVCVNMRFGNRSFFTASKEANPTRTFNITSLGLGSKHPSGKPGYVRLYPSTLSRAAVSW